MAQLMPLPLTVSCFSKIQIGFTFLVLADPGSPGHRAVKRVCVCVCVVEEDHFELIRETFETTTEASLSEVWSGAQQRLSIRRLTESK